MQRDGGTTPLLTLTGENKNDRNNKWLFNYRKWVWDRINRTMFSWCKDD